MGMEGSGKLKFDVSVFQVAFRISWCRPVIGGSKSKLQPWMVLHMVWRVASFDANYCWRFHGDKPAESETVRERDTDFCGREFGDEARVQGVVLRSP